MRPAECRVSAACLVIREPNRAGKDVARGRRGQRKYIEKGLMQPQFNQ